MKALVTWTGTYLKPLYNSDHDGIRSAKLKMGETYEIEIKKKRNVLFHRKFFALLNLVFQNQDHFKDNEFEAFRGYFLIKAGEYTRTDTPKGAFYYPKSISFSKMDEIEFSRLYDKIINVACEEIGADKEDIKNEIEQYF